MSPPGPLFPDWDANVWVQFWDWLDSQAIYGPHSDTQYFLREKMKEFLRLIEVKT